MTTRTMKAAYLRAYGNADQFEVGELPRPQPGPGEVLLKVAYAGVNPADWKDREGYTSAFFDASFPYVIGFDAAGQVVETGEGVTACATGDRVFTASNHGQGKQGSYAEYLVVGEDRLAPVPEQLDLRSAAAIPVAALTGWQALFAMEKGALKAGQRVLIHGASGGLGSFAVQFARSAGARVAATCSRRNLDYVRSLGAERAIDYGEGAIAREILDWAPQGLDLIVDAVGCETLPDALDLLVDGGRLVNIATLVGDGDVAAGIAAARARGKEKIFAIMDDNDSGRTLREIAALVVGGAVKMPPIQSFPLAEVADAHRQVESGHVRGKLVLEIDGSLA